MTQVTEFSPFLPSEKALTQHGLPDRARALDQKASSLAGWLAPMTLATLREYMAVINSYYSNLIEGNNTLPHDVRSAQAGDYSNDPERRDLQMESVAHIKVQHWLSEQPNDLETVFSIERIQAIHEQFYSQLPESLRYINNDGELLEVRPGELRNRGVRVGRHIPPPPEAVSAALQSMLSHYRSGHFQGLTRTLVSLAAHHRLLWIHPFLDGNGRVARLWLDDCLRATGTQGIGVWCISRGLAKASATYKARLHNADQPQQGKTDGRGPLSESTLVEFLDFMLSTAQDQVGFMTDLLDLGNLQVRLSRFVDTYNASRDKDAPPLKPATATIIWSAFMQGEISRSKAIEMTGEQSERSARRVLSQLKSLNLLTETSSRSPLRWTIHENMESVYFPGLAPTGK